MQYVLTRDECGKLYRMKNESFQNNAMFAVGDDDGGGDTDNAGQSDFGGDEVVIHQYHLY